MKLALSKVHEFAGWLVCPGFTDNFKPLTRLLRYFYNVIKVECIRTEGEKPERRSAMAKPKGKHRAKKKTAPKKKVTLEVIFEDMKKIHKKLDNMEREILAIQGVMGSQTPPPPKKEDETDIEVKFGFLTSI